VQDTGQAQEKANEVAGQAQEKVQGAAQQAKGRISDQVDQRSTQAGERVSQQAGDMRTVAQQLREQGKDGPAKIADQVADRTERAGSYLSESDADRILSDVEDFARKNPWAVAAAGLALGFAASRMLKASSSQRYEQRSQDGVAGQLPRSTPTRTAPPVDQPLSSLDLADEPVADRPETIAPVTPGTRARP
jgi:uncharacterized protein YjbJ (UPF0337 family)